jgi:hypothetical protein
MSQSKYLIKCGEMKISTMSTFVIDEDDISLCDGNSKFYASFEQAHDAAMAWAGEETTAKGDKVRVLIFCGDPAGDRATSFFEIVEVDAREDARLEHGGARS